jgi:hypothetical protein
MANVLQRFIYNIGNAVPLLLMTAVVWIIQYKSWQVPVVIIVIGIVLAILSFVCFAHGRKKCSVKSIRVSEISSKDSWVVAYVIAYFLPFANMVISDFHISILVVVGLLLAVVLVPSVMALPNFLLFVAGYHFYEIATDDTGVHDYLLISKRKRIRNKTDIKTVMRVFEKLLIDTREET